MPFGFGVELGRVEVGRERDDVADVLGGRDDLDPLVGRDGHDVVVDEVPAGPDHDVAVGLEGLLEGRRVIALDPVDHGRLVDVGVDLPGGRHPAGLVQGQLLVPDLEDRVGVEPVEGAQADQLVVALPAEGPRVGPVGERPAEPLAIVGHGGLRPVGGGDQAALLGGPEGARAGGHDLVEQGGDLAGRLDLDRLPQPDLGDDRSRLRRLEERRDRLHPAGHRVEPLGQRREVPGEQGEERVADAVEGGRPALPGPLDVGVEDVPPEVVDLEVALEPAER